MPFAEHLKLLGISGTRVFGDSITAGLNASQPHLAWPALFAAEVDGLPLRNHAIPGTVLQHRCLPTAKLDRETALNASPGRCSTARIATRSSSSTAITTRAIRPRRRA